MIVVRDATGRVIREELTLAERKRIRRSRAQEWAQTRAARKRRRGYAWSPNNYGTR